MNIRIPKTVKQEASQKLQQAGQLKKILTIFCGILLVLSLAITGIQYLLDDMMSRSGGLGNLGTRSILSTFQTFLPIANTLLIMGLDLGLLACMLRISRGQYTSANTLRAGINRYWAMLGCTILQLFLYLGMGIGAIYISMIAFLFTPLSQTATAILEPMVSAGADTNAVLNQIFSDADLTNRFASSMIPLYIIFFVVFAALALPLSYRMRVTNHILLDNPRFGALRALFESFRMTRRNCMAFFKLDLSFWWYHLLSVVVSALCYGDILLNAIGVALPFSATVASLLAYVLYLIFQIGLYYFFRPKIEVSTALIYDAIRPKEDPQQGVVLGNIFQM